MKKLVLFSGIFFLLAAQSKAQEIKEPVFYSYTPCLMQRITPPLDFSFYFHPTFIRSTFIHTTYPSSFANENTMVFHNFQAMDFHFDKAAVFCRMENECTKRYGVMFSIHAGGYSER